MASDFYNRSVIKKHTLFYIIWDQKYHFSIHYCQDIPEGQII